MRWWRARGPWGARWVWWVGLAVSSYWLLPEWAQFVVVVVGVAYLARRHWLRGVYR